MVLNGGVGLIVAYGQTGSGKVRLPLPSNPESTITSEPFTSFPLFKTWPFSRTPQTHTIQGINDLLSRTLFPTAQSFAATNFPTSTLPAKEVFGFELEAYEVLGRDAWDLLGREEGRERGNKVDFQEDMVRTLTHYLAHPFLPRRCDI